MDSDKKLNQPRRCRRRRSDDNSSTFFFEKSSYKWCTPLAAANDKICQLLSHGRWFSQGTPASSTTKTGRHDIAENC